MYSSRLFYANIISVQLTERSQLRMVHTSDEDEH